MMRKLLLILPLFLVAGVYLSIPLLAEKLTRQLLQEQGISTHQLEIEHPGWNSLIIPQASFQLDNQNQEVSLQARDIEVNFTPLDLLFNQRIAQITIPQLDADISLALPANEEASEPTQLPLISPAQLLTELPFNSLSISRYNINLNINQRSDLSFNGTANLTSEGLICHIQTETVKANETLSTSVTTATPATTNQNSASPLLSIDLQANSDNRIKLISQHSGQPLSEIEFGLSEVTEQLHVESNHRVDIGQFISLLQTEELRQLLNNLSVDIPELPETDGQLLLKGKSTLAAAQTVTQIIAAADSHYQISAALSLNQPVTELNSIDITFNSELQQRQDNLTVSLTQFDSTLRKISTPSASSNKIELSLSHPLSVTATVTELLTLSAPQLPAITVPPAQLQIRGDSIVLQQSDSAPITISYQPAKISTMPFQLNKPEINADVKLPKVEVEVPEQPTPPFSISSTISYTNNQLNTRFNSIITDAQLDSGHLLISGSSKTALPKENNQFPHTTAFWKIRPLALQGIEKVLQNYLPDLPAELVVKAGTLKHRGWLDLNHNGIALRLLQSATSVDASFDQTHAYNADWSSETTRSHRGTLRDKGRLVVEFIDLGTPVESLKGSYRYNQRPGRKARIELASANARLLGGEITTLPLAFNPSEPEIDTALALTNLDLAQVIALEQQPGLTGQGTLNGQMPFRYQQGKISISDGQINSNTEGGWIRFDPPAEFMALTQTNPSLKIAFDALRNFNFSSLGIRLNLAEDGDAILNTRIKGFNPDWNNSQPIDFSVNIEENIPKLIETLQFTDKLTRGIEKRYR
ncbi:YdbH domain-containing protein [Amphritea sp. HPY]|uniref:YdbH domain-containing protein n=1 Tax=Amphritea sp. HPY TaxID=3421652 RepID=UPI003D7E20D2